MLSKTNWYERLADEGVWTEKQKGEGIYVVRYFVIVSERER